MYNYYTGHSKLPKDRTIILLGEVGSHEAKNLALQRFARSEQIVLINKSYTKYKRIKRENPHCRVICGDFFRVVQEEVESGRLPAIIDFDSQMTINRRQIFGNNAEFTFTRLMALAPKGCLLTGNYALHCVLPNLHVENSGESRYSFDWDERAMWFKKRILTAYKELQYDKNFRRKTYSIKAWRHYEPYTYCGRGHVTAMGTQYFFLKG